MSSIIRVLFRMARVAENFQVVHDIVQSVAVTMMDNEATSRFVATPAFRELASDEFSIGPSQMNFEGFPIAISRAADFASLKFMTARSATGALRTTENYSTDGTRLRLSLTTPIGIVRSKTRDTLPSKIIRGLPCIQTCPRTESATSISDSGGRLPEILLALNASHLDAAAALQIRRSTHSHEVNYIFNGAICQN